MNFLLSIKPWSTLPIIFITVSIICAISFYYLGKREGNNYKKYNKNIFIIGLILLAMEIGHEVKAYIISGRYDWSSFPFQFCSVAMYLSLIVPFIKEGKIKKGFVMFFALFTTLSGILPLGLGQDQLTRWPDFIGILFSFAWHGILLCEGLYSLGYGNVGSNLKKEYKSILISFSVFFSLTCIAQILNVIIHYSAGAWDLPNGLEYKEVGYIDNYIYDPDSVSLFYISPYFASNIAVVFGSVWRTSGWIACWMAYVGAFLFGGCVVYSITYGSRKLYNYLENRNKAVIEVKQEEIEIVKTDK